MNMPIKLTFRQWQQRNFHKLLACYFLSNNNWENWDDYCALCFICEQNKERHLS